MARHPAGDFGEPVGLGIEPVKIAVEHHLCVFARRQPFDFGERREVAVETARDVQHVGRQFRRSVEHRGG